MAHAAATVRKWTMLIHRWMGVVFCMLFVAWFVSGIVMMYAQFPRVEAEQRLSRAASLDPSQIRIGPAEALKALPHSAAPSQVRLSVLDGRPVYRFAFGRRTAAVFADDGQRFSQAPQELALRNAAAWTGLPASEASFCGLITKDDQWTVYSSVRPYGPFWKFSWPNGEEVYVSRSTGEVVQDTTRASRMGAYFGAIPHWLYFTWLSSNGSLWTQVVIWLSGAGTVVSILGLVVGVWLYSPAKAYRFPKGRSSIPYSGQKRWHMILGLVFGVFTCTWVFNGLMSMGPFSWVSDPERPNLERSLRGDRVHVEKFEAESPAAAIAAAGSKLRVKEMEFVSFGGKAYYLALEAPGKSRLVSMENSVHDIIETSQIMQTVAHAALPASVVGWRIIRQYESYYIDRENRKPLPVVYVELNDPGRSAFYIDPRTGRVVESYGPRSRWNRWLYQGLHSMDLPALYAHRPAWDIVVLVLMLGGTALCITSVVIAWRRIRCKMIGKTIPAPGALNAAPIPEPGATL